MNRTASLVFGVASYAVFFACFGYSILWIADLGLPHTIDRGPDAPLGLAIAIDLALLGVFALQHSVMARPGFKRVWTRIVPRPIERSVYVLATVAALALLYTQWRPIPGSVWQAEADWARAALWGGHAFGWALLLYATCLIDHFELFGVRQVVRHWQGAGEAGKQFRTPGLYRLVRHPIYVGWTVIFWVTPSMTLGHLLFAAACTAYMLIAIPLEERDLVDELGDAYRDYRKRVPALIPGLRRTTAETPASLATGSAE